MSEIEDQPTLAVSLTVKDAGAALDFYVKALGAEELFRMPSPDGGVPHAEFMIGDTRLYISDESPEWNAMALPEGVRAPCLLSIATDDCDASFKRAVDAGAEALLEPADQFWGMRVGMILDSWGYRWSFRQFIEEVSPEEMMKRAKELFGG
ncbi:MAG: VOC family protein [Verrucomicrobiota bacterium]